MSGTVHHSGLRVGDLDRSIDFYCRGFGLQVVNRAVFEGPDLARVVDVPGAVLEYAFLAGSNVILELIEYKEPAGKSYSLRNNDIGAAHCCFQVDDIDEYYERLRAMGARFTSPPQAAPDVEPFAGLKYTYCKDPDGITIELMQPGPGMRLEALLALASPGVEATTG